MHAEVPKKGALASLKTFIAEYAMIVISILTALGLEHAAQSWHRKHLAHEAAERIQEEVTYNLSELQSSIKKNDAELKKFAELRTFMKDGLEESADKVGQAKTEYDKEFRIKMKERVSADLNFSANAPTLRREAWEVAVASQTASWMEASLLQRYSSIYAVQRDTNSMVAQSMAMINGPTIIGAIPHLELKAKDKGDRDREIYVLVTDIFFQLNVIQANLKALESSIKESSTKA
jgi:hypothetical protein